MTNRLGLYLGDSFCEMSLIQDSGPAYKRWFLPKLSLERALREFTQEHTSDIDEVIIGHQLIHQIVRRRLGSPPAFLVTSGFENWLDMSLPISTDYFSLKPNRVRSPLNRDLVFGISERINTEGKIEIPLDMTELEFLASKLEMSEVKTLAIGFLHSNKNHEHEKKTTEFFRERGYRVFSISDTISDPTFLFANEKHRWLRTILNAYVQPLFEESFNQHEECIRSVLGENTTINYITSTGEKLHLDNTDILPSMFGDIWGIKNHFKLKQDNLTNVLYFGLEDFLFIPLADAMNPLWKSEFGPVFLDAPIYERLKIQPTTLIEKDFFWDVPHYQNFEVGYEPGPMCLGKGHKLSFLDLLFSASADLQKPGIAELLGDEARQRRNLSRISESLQSQTRQKRKADQLNHEHVADILLEHGFKMMAVQLESICWQKTKVIACGPYAQMIVPQISKYLTNCEITLADQETDYLLSQSLLEKVAHGE